MQSFWTKGPGAFVDQGSQPAFLRKLCCDVALCPCVTTATTETAHCCNTEKCSPKELSAYSLKENSRSEEKLEKNNICQEVN